MAAFLCRACGGILELVEGRTLCRCKFCDTLQSVPRLDSAEKAELCARAETLRREYRYDKAVALYEELIRLSPTDADLYWALTLCRYGAELSPDGSVSLNRIQARSVLSDEDYKLALKFADNETRALMERQAERIDRIRREGVELSGGTEYDVYLCAREADENGRRTEDSVIAAGLYSRLTAEGIRVFLPQKSLEDKSGGEWEPYIFAALSSARVMIVVGTSRESFEDVWVRNAWNRFFGKTIIPVLRDMPPSELPDELSKLQALDMSRLGAESDLISAVKSVTGDIVSAVRVNAENDPMIRRAELFLEDGDFERARDIGTQLLSKRPDNAGAYVILLLAEYGLANENALDDMTESFTNSENYRLAMRYGSEPLRARLKEHSNRALYKKFTARLDNAADNEREYLAAAAELRTLGSYSDAAELAERAEKTAAELREKAELQRREGVYELAARAVSESSDAAILRSAEHSLRSLGDYKDAAALADKCAARIAELPAVQTAVFADDEPKRLKKYLPYAAGGAALLAAAVIFIVSANAPRKPEAPVSSGGISSDTASDITADAPLSEREEKYAKADALMKDGNYSEAELLFTILGDYKNSSEMVSECKYLSAAALMEEHEYDMAERAFERLGDYSDSRVMILQCRYQKAQYLLENGDTAAARPIFEELDGRWECEEFLKRIEYIEADRLLEAGKYKEARDAFKEIWQYSDSLQKFYESRYKYAAELMENGEYEAAADEFHELIGYEDSEEQYHRAQYYYGLQLEQEGDLQGAYLTLEIAGGYEDSEEQMTRVRNKYIRTDPFDFYFGEYYGSLSNKKTGLGWKVLHIEGDMALIRSYIIDYRQFDDDDPDCTWENSSLREWLNGEFYEDAFSDAEKAQIRTSVFETGSGEYNYIGTSGSGISDKVFLFNTAEMENKQYYGSLAKTHLSAYAQRQLPDDYGTLFCWGRDRPLIRFYNARGDEIPPSVNATYRNCVMVGMWIYIGD